MIARGSKRSRMMVRDSDQEREGPSDSAESERNCVMARDSEKEREGPNDSEREREGPCDGKQPSNSKKFLTVFTSGLDGFLLTATGSRKR